MGYTHNLPQAASRHLQAADLLDKSHRRDVAGYLYGIAAECAIKHMLIRTRLAPEHNKTTIEYKHFPELRTLLRDALAGRRPHSAPLFKFVFNDRFMNNWAIKMRYADARQIDDAWVDNWKQQAHEAVNAMES